MFGVHSVNLFCPGYVIVCHKTFSNNDSAKNFLPDNTKPLPEPVLINPLCGIWQISQEVFDVGLKIIDWGLQAHFPGTNNLNM